jgi:hypothetical protein
VYFGPEEGDMYDIFMKVANVAEKYEFYHLPVTCASLNGGLDAPSISIHRQFDNSPIHYSGDLNLADVAGWLEEESWPQLIDFSQDAIDIIFGHGRKDAIILFTNEKEGKEYLDVFEETSYRKRGSLMFVISGTEEGV